MTTRQELIKEIQLKLGAGIIDLELDPEHYEFAVTSAFDRYRQRSSNALQESFLFLDLQPEVMSYTLPREVQSVRAIYRRTMGGTSGGASIDPFSLSFTNNVYAIQNPGNFNMGGAGALATYDFAMQFQELAGRMFGRDLLFNFDPSTKKLVIERKIGGTEHVLLHIYNERPEEVLLGDYATKPWIRDWATAVCKEIMGQARSKFQGGLGGPNGGVSLNGEMLLSQAKEEFERLEDEIKNFIDSNSSMPFTIG